MSRAIVIVFVLWNTGFWGNISALEQAAAPVNTEKPAVQAGVFVDTYYAAGIARPAVNDRQYLTQVARDREFNINLAHIEARLADKRVRGRLALQFGTAVNANYQNEPTAEKYSNQFSHRNLQEAYAGYQLFDKFWLDAGIFFGHIGFEQWPSHQNWNYTRALTAENTPYYSTGIRMSYEPVSRLNLQFHILNGWQVITPPNRDKSFGTQISYEISPQVKIIHNTFAGNIAPDGVASQYRFYSDLILQFYLSRSLQFAVMVDAGAQKISGDTFYTWYTGAVYARYFLSTEWSIATRFEYFIDRQQVMVTTGTADGFQVAGATFNLSFQPEEAYVLRFEYRNFFSRESIFYLSEGIRPQQHILSFAASLML